MKPPVYWGLHLGWITYCLWLVWSADISLGLQGLMWYCFARGLNAWLDYRKSAKPDDNATA